MYGHGAYSEAPYAAQPEADVTNASVEPGVGALTITGYAPTVTAEQFATVEPGVGALVVTGFAPTITATASPTVEPGVGALTITGYAPTVSTGTLRGRLLSRSSRRRPEFSEFTPGVNAEQLVVPGEPQPAPAYEPRRRLSLGLEESIQRLNHAREIAERRAAQITAVSEARRVELRRLETKLAAQVAEARRIAREEKERIQREKIALEIKRREEAEKRRKEDAAEEEILLSAVEAQHDAIRAAIKDLMKSIKAAIEDDQINEEIEADTVGAIRDLMSRLDKVERRLERMH